MRVGHQRTTATFGALLASVLLGACAASRQYFEPTERVTGQTENGYSQSLYPLTGPHGPFGEMTLWSRGAYRSPDGRSVVQVGFLLHNTSNEPITLRASEVRIGTMRTDDALLSELSPADPADLTVAPQAFGETQYHFVMPDEVDPGEIRAFRLRWAVQGGDAMYRQRTVFIELHAHDPYPPPYASGYPCWPYGPYDCFYGPPAYYGPYPPPAVIHHHHPSVRTDRTSVRPKK